MFLQLNHQQFDIYKATRTFVKECYLATKEFPSEEKFCVNSTNKKSGTISPFKFSRRIFRKTQAERKRFFEASKGSLIEIDGALDAAEDLACCKKENLTNLGISVNCCFSMLSKLISN